MANGEQSGGEFKTEKDARYIMLVEDIKQDISNWAQKRFWLVAILGGLVTVLGGYHLFEEVLKSMLEERINKQIERLTTESDKEIDNFRGVFEKSSTAMADLHATSEAVKQNAKNAEDEITAAKNKIDELQIQISKFDKNVAQSTKQMEDRLDLAANFAHDYSFEAASSDDIVNGKERINAEYFELRISAIENAVRAVSVSGNDELKLKNIVDDLVSKETELNNSRKIAITNLYKNSTKKIILYLKKGEGFMEQALLASKSLRNEGFKVDIWISPKDDIVQAQEDIGKDFQGANDIISMSDRGIIVHDISRDEGDEVRKIVQKFPLFRNLEVSPAKFNPDAVFRKRPPEYDYSPSDIVLLYILAEPRE